MTEKDNKTAKMKATTKVEKVQLLDMKRANNGGATSFGAE